MFVRPASGLKVRDPITLQLLPETGKEVPETTYWVRRLNDNDVVLATPPTETTAPESAAAKKE